MKQILNTQQKKIRGQLCNFENKNFYFENKATWRNETNLIYPQRKKYLQNFLHFVSIMTLNDQRKDEKNQEWTMKLKISKMLKKISFC